MSDYKKLAEEIYWSLNAQIPSHYNDGDPREATFEDINNIAQALEQAVLEDRKLRLKWPSAAEINKAFPPVLVSASAGKPAYLKGAGDMYDWLKSQVKFEENK